MAEWFPEWLALGYNFLNSCTELTVDGTAATAVREIDGGKETVSTSLPLTSVVKRISRRKRPTYS
jgi:electron transfer flavoprotein alpha/beta subunit